MLSFFVYLFFATFDGVKLVILFVCLVHVFLPSAICPSKIHSIFQCMTIQLTFPNNQIGLSYMLVKVLPIASNDCISANYFNLSEA